jgi:hypothetical protein
MSEGRSIHMRLGGISLFVDMHALFNFRCQLTALTLQPDIIIKLAKAECRYS